MYMISPTMRPLLSVMSMRPTSVVPTAGFAEMLAKGRRGTQFDGSELAHLGTCVLKLQTLIQVIIPEKP